MHEFLRLLAQHQFRTEHGGWLPKPPEERARQEKARAQFHQELLDRSIDPEQVSKSAEEAGGAIYYGLLSAGAIADLRQNLADCPVSFSQAEPPWTTAILAHSFRRLRHAARASSPSARFVLATDCIYRPHASVQKISSDTFLILMSRYLLVDLRLLADIFSYHIERTRNGAEQEPWLRPTFPAELVGQFETSPLHLQFPYALCAAAEGERYRFATQINDDAFSEKVARELFAGALDFLIGHELAHVAEKHLDGKPSRSDEAPWIYKRGFDLLRGWFGASADEHIETFIQTTMPHHERELAADSLGLLWAAGFGEGGAWDLRLMGSQLALCTVAFLDRATFFIATGKDPGMLIGLEKYSLPGVVDLLLTKATHPWGKTRATYLVNSMLALFDGDYEKPELERKLKLMVSIGDVFGFYGANALQAVSFTNKRPGEYLAWLTPDDKLQTRYFPPEATADGGHEDITSDPTQYYIDVEGQRLIGKPTTATELVNWRESQMNRNRESE